MGAVASYRIQRGTLAGSYETLYKTGKSRPAWRAYFETRIMTGEKKRIQEKIGNGGKWRTLKNDKEYWT